MASSSSAFTCAFPAQRSLFSSGRFNRVHHRPLSLRASTTDDAECNVDECAPDKEVGKVSMEWLAGEKTKVAGTYPPRKKGWTGYVEKDTAGQTNIYSVEPAVYVAESAISSGMAGSSADGSENTVAVVAASGLVAIAAASAILVLVGKNSPPPVTPVDYNGPSLSYYINKFKAQEIVQAPEPSVSVEPETQLGSEPVSQQVSEPQIQTDSEIVQNEPSTPEPDSLSALLGIDLSAY